MTEDAQAVVVNAGTTALNLNLDPADEWTAQMLGLDSQMLREMDPEAAMAQIRMSIESYELFLSSLVPEAPPSSVRTVREWVDQSPLEQLPGRVPHASSSPADRSSVAVAATPTPPFGDLFTSPDGVLQFELIPYNVATDTDIPLVTVVQEDDAVKLSVVLWEEGRELSTVLPLPHLVGVTLRYRLPVAQAGGSVLQELAFPSVQFGRDEHELIATMPLPAPTLRRQVIAALCSAESETSLVVNHGVTLSIPTGEILEDGQAGYRTVRLALDSVVQPSPLVLPEEERARLGERFGAVQPMGRLSVFHGDRSHPYWHDPVRPERYYFLPDRFLLARLPDEGHRPALKIRATSAASEADLKFTVEFSARPVTEESRLSAALPTLEADAQASGATVPVRLEVLPEAQPALRLALPQNGAPSTALTERPAALIDLERGLTHAETFGLEDFRLVYEALFGASLSLLRGEVRIAAGGETPEDIPLELRLDRTAGGVLALVPGQAKPDGISARLTNVIESTVRVDHLTAMALCGADRVVLRVEGIAAGTQLAPGAGLDVRLAPESPLPAAGFDVIRLDETGVVAEPDRKVMWDLVFDRSVQAHLTRNVTVEAVPALFLSPDRPGDRVAAFVVTVEHGGTVRLTEDHLSAATTVRVPIEPLVSGVQAPPIRYQTETVWQSGGVGVSPWRQTEHTILLPVKTVPPPGGGP